MARDLRGEIVADVLTIETHGKVRLLTLNRPDVRNALNDALNEALANAVIDADADDSIAVTAITGAGSAFCSGDDLRKATDAAAAGKPFRGPLRSHRRSICEVLIDARKPTIAIVNGPAVAGGFELALACDLRFAASGARFGIPPAKLGLVYSLASTKRLVELVGPGLARDYLFSGRIFGLAEARAAGLVDREYPATDIAAETQAYAETLCRRSQCSIRAAKSIIREAVSGATEESAHIRSLRANAFLGPDLQEGVRAFRERRPAAFPWS